ncbi:uncharacterized protein TM35_000151510 [Trypanosoma theileri]|uniref:Vps72/YL1 N-terminal domain-containing protein n=1 Tax=Trypanosoma theileri TaxID=67003 RepID=A0A1X0NX77_9TRYP|nr:uncharacterized protein TM35_000151510 [Trypanosoma theileri]ORC88720.1 hypothetical protein TM35_000151510 [Trypanosoma theileri]
MLDACSTRREEEKRRKALYVMSSRSSSGDDDNDRRWDVEESRRPRRANRGNLLQELLEKGLNSDEEHLLNDLSDATTDSTFSASGEEAMDEIDSDFSDEEVEGVLDGEEVETEAMLQQRERQERKKERQQALRRMGGTQRGGTANTAKPPTLRLRPPPTIPLEERLRAAHKRAREVRAAAASAVTGEREEMNLTTGGGAAQYNVGATMTRRRRPHRTRGGTGITTITTTTTTGMNGEEDGGEVKQRVMYTSSRSVLEQFGVPVVISFSKCLPRLFQTK